MAQPQPRKATWRMGVRERMRLQWVVVAFICVLLYFVVFRPAYIYIVERRDFQTCQSNVRQIAQAIAIYRGDYDDTLPLASNWMDSVQGFTTATSGTGRTVEDIFRCPLDKSGAPSSYAYNDLLSGLSPTVHATDREAEERRTLIGRMDRAPLVIEKPGTPRNGHVTLRNWDDVIANLMRPHLVPTPTGSLILVGPPNGGCVPTDRNDEQLADLKGKRF